MSWKRQQFRKHKNYGGGSRRSDQCSNKGNWLSSGWQSDKTSDGEFNTWGDYANSSECGRTEDTTEDERWRY